MIVGTELATFLHVLCIKVETARHNLRTEHVATVVGAHWIHSASQRLKKYAETQLARNKQSRPQTAVPSSSRGLQTTVHSTHMQWLSPCH